MTVSEAVACFAPRTHKTLSLALVNMRSLASVSIVLAALAAGVQAKEEIQWPENGAIKMITPRAPQQVTIALPGCVTVQVDFGQDLIAVTTANGKRTELQKSERLKNDGGQLVTLMSREGDKTHIIVNAESATGGFETRTETVNVASCLISRLDVTSPTPQKLQDVKVGVNKPIEDIYRQHRGFTTS